MNDMKRSFKIGWLGGLIIIFGLLLGYALGDSWIGVILSVVVAILIVAYVTTRKE